MTVNYKFCSITASICTLLTLSTQASCCLQVFLQCLHFLPEELRKITLRVHNWIWFTESAVFCRQEVNNCRSWIVLHNIRSR